jgi:putative methyltransferase
LDHLVDDASGDVDMDRLKALSDFQESVILHAMSFPKAQRISYSTCSIHEVENEGVCSRVLEKNSEWKLIKCLPQWHRRGLNGLDEVVRVMPEDNTNGFFVAVFERVKCE